jgi:probable F420-dependent oxidoreductase
VTRFVVSLPIRRGESEGAFTDPETIARLVGEAEDAGFWGVTAPDHIVSPRAWAEAGGGEQWYDPFVLLSYLAGRTSAIRLILHVVVLPYRSPFAVAKAVASLDRISGGRAVLGVGSGYLREEFDILGVPFEDRGRRTDESLRVITDCWTQDQLSVQGRSFAVAPRPLQVPRPPIWVGGNSMRAVRRAVELGDCWVPFDVEPEDVARGAAHAEALGRAVEIAAPLGRVQRDPPARGRGVAGDEVAARAEAFERAGAGIVKAAFGGEDPDDWLANLRWFAAEVMPRDVPR